MFFLTALGTGSSKSGTCGLRFRWGPSVLSDGHLLIVKESSMACFIKVQSPCEKPPKAAPLYITGLHLGGVWRHWVYDTGCAFVLWCMTCQYLLWTGSQVFPARVVHRGKVQVTLQQRTCPLATGRHWKAVCPYRNFSKARLAPQAQ